MVVASSLEVSAASWAMIHWKRTADALYMHPLPASLQHQPLYSDTHIHLHMYRHTDRRMGGGFNELWIGASKHNNELWKRHGINIWMQICSVTKDIQ